MLCKKNKIKTQIPIILAQKRERRRIQIEVKTTRKSQNDGVLISRTKDRGEAVRVSAVSRLCLSSPVPLDPLPPYIPGREKCLKEHKRKQERQHMGMKEEERDDIGFT